MINKSKILVVIAGVVVTSATILMKKKAKKDRERIERRRDSNELLEKTLLGNKFSFREDGDTLSFRLRDVYRD